MAWFDIKLYFIYIVIILNCKWIIGKYDIINSGYLSPLRNYNDWDQWGHRPHILSCESD